MRSGFHGTALWPGRQALQSTLKDILDKIHIAPSADALVETPAGNADAFLIEAAPNFIRQIQHASGISSGDRDQANLFTPPSKNSGGWLDGETRKSLGNRLDKPVPVGRFKAPRARTDIHGEKALLFRIDHSPGAWQQPKSRTIPAIDEIDCFLAEMENRQLAKHPPQFERGRLSAIHAPARLDMGTIRRTSKDAEPPQGAPIEFRRQILISHSVDRRIGHNSIRIPSRDDPEFLQPLAREHLESRIQKLFLQVVHAKSGFPSRSAERASRSPESRPQEPSGHFLGFMVKFDYQAEIKIQNEPPGQSRLYHMCHRHSSKNAAVDSHREGSAHCAEATQTTKNQELPRPL